MSSVKLTPFAKLFVTVTVLGVGAYAVYTHPEWLEKVAPKAQKQPSAIPPIAKLPDLPEATRQEGGTGATSTPGCIDKPEVRFHLWAWNAQMGLMLATGGKQSTAESLMCKNGVNLRLIREDNTDNMASLLVTFAEALKRGEAHPKEGTHFIAIMGDGSAAFLRGVNDRLSKLGPDYMAAVVGSAGYSRGEDKFMGPPEWKKNPQAARGGLVAGVLRDGDWNIAMKWLGDNRIANNPDESVYDPEALNWVGASDYVDAAQKYVSNYCAELKHAKTGAKEKVCVNGVVTWTPGDVTVAEQKGGLVTIVSTREYRWQMPHVVIGIKKWMNANRPIVSNMLAAMFAGADQIKESDDALRTAAAVSANVYNEKDADYWYKYFRIQTEKDRQGLIVELGGSAVSNLADNMQLFGLTTGSANIFAATYTTFGDIVKSQYPSIVPSYYPVSAILDSSFVKELGEKTKPSDMARADLPTFTSADKVRDVISRKSWDIQFESGSAKFTPKAKSDLEALFRDLVVAGGTLVEIHGHTDNQGSQESNQQLSETRSFAVKSWLESQSSINFPEGRIRVFAHGMMQPIAPNTTADGRAKNRRVEIVIGTN